MTGKNKFSNTVSDKRRPRWPRTVKPEQNMKVLRASVKQKSTMKSHNYYRHYSASLRTLLKIKPLVRRLNYYFDH